MSDNVSIHAEANETEDKMAAIIIRVPEHIRREFKTLCVRNGVSMRAVFAEFINRELRRDPRTKSRRS